MEELKMKTNVLFMFVMDKKLASISTFTLT